MRRIGMALGLLLVIASAGVQTIAVARRRGGGGMTRLLLVAAALVVALATRSAGCLRLWTPRGNKPLEVVLPEAHGGNAHRAEEDERSVSEDRGRGGGREARENS